jgi:hypothetical protein
MKVITIKQPYASLIANGYKIYEFRTWKTSYRGKLLIHAGKAIDKTAMEKYKHLNLEYPSGCIIAECTLTDIIPIDNNMRDYLNSINEQHIYDNIILNSKWNGYGFYLENIKKIEPIYLKGKLSLWNYDYKE